MSIYVRRRRFKISRILLPNRGQVLLFLRPPDIHHQILNVFLLPSNISLDEVKAQQGEAEYIRVPSDYYLIIGQSYSVHCDEAFKIQPEHAQVDIECGPIFLPTFEVFLPINQEKVTLMVKDQEGTQVWKCVVNLNLTGPRRKNLQRNLQRGKRTKMTEVDLINLLDDLADDEFKIFKWLLKNEKVGDIEPIKESRLSRAEREEIVDLMVQKYEFAGAVKVMKSVLKKINRNDLVMKLSNISSGAEGGESSTGATVVQKPTTSEQPAGPSTSNTTLNVSEDNREDQLGPDDPERLFREDFRPEVLTESANISYRFRGPGPGVFRCTLTGLVFVMAQEAELLYRTVQWDESHLQPAGKMAAGLLFNIQSPDGALSQLQLPHCETMDAPLPEGLLSVAHIADDGMSILEPLEITDTHVVVNVPRLSAFGLVWDLAILLNIPIRIRGQVLLFLRPVDTCLQKLNVFLLQDNIPLEEVKAKQGEAEYIEIASDCYLINGQSYSVHCDEASTIQPENKEFRPKYGPNFHPTFEVFLPTKQKKVKVKKKKVTLMVKNEQGAQVWKCDVYLNLTGPRRKNPKRNLPAGDTVPAKRTKMTKTDLINTLGDLVDEEFKSFKSYLKDEKVDNTEPIKVNKLAKADRQETVDLMVQKYEFATAVKVMKSVLKNISRTDLVRKLSNIGSGAEGPDTADC
ncbi:uncharacterized protein LOC121888123 [Thunnus maccoyii]|uniref:uncharacterized protein LOC121888123 n=1 Tax=Thunnus maccoyii TaxID=8240 RepID=UPI001C4CA581|nr:uncharacterized protein LOC121888123 [Thunnus maccoyii]XP_042255431.1 uncharacterized protein LOC121888123 [Thunnus maccoyii]